MFDASVSLNNLQAICPTVQDDLSYLNYSEIQNASNSSFDRYRENVPACTNRTELTLFPKNYLGQI